MNKKKSGNKFRMLNVVKGSLWSVQLSLWSLIPEGLVLRSNLWSVFICEDSPLLVWWLLFDDFSKLVTEWREWRVIHWISTIFLCEFHWGNTSLSDKKEWPNWTLFLALFDGTLECWAVFLESKAIVVEEKEENVSILDGLI